MYKLELSSIERLILELSINGEIPMEGGELPHPDYIANIINVYGKKSLKHFQKISEHLNTEKFKNDEEFEEMYNDYYNDYDMRMYIKLNYDCEKVLDQIREKLNLNKKKYE